MPHWLVIDLEATTDEGGWPLEEMEIIEIGATLVNAAGHEVEQFQRYVRPERRPHLTHFCRELTHISQADVDAAAPWPSVWAQFEHWLNAHPTPLAGWASWGEYDRRQIEQQVNAQGVENCLSQVEHLNLKKRFAEARQLPRQVGLKKALSLAGLQFQGQQHRALTDARNTARLLPLVLPLQSR
jgi:inhibitor of KinA sporulation pathway (predicted exonuclease)